MTTSASGEIELDSVQPSLTDDGRMPSVDKDAQESLQNDSKRNSSQTAILQENASADKTEMTYDNHVIHHQPESSTMLSPLDILLDVAQVVVHKANFRRQPREITDGTREVIQRMEVINESRAFLYYVEQDKLSTDVDKSFIFRLFTKDGVEALQVHNPGSHTMFCMGASCHCMRTCRFHAVVYSPPGVIIGFIRQSHKILMHEFQILGPHEELLLLLRGGPSDMEVYTADMEGELGRLAIHGWVGVMHEIRRSSDDYGLTFPLDLDVRVKATLLAAIFSLDWLYHAGSGQLSVSPSEDDKT